MFLSPFFITWKINHHTSSRISYSPLISQIRLPFLIFPLHMAHCPLISLTINSLIDLTSLSRFMFACTMSAASVVYFLNVISLKSSTLLFFFNFNFLILLCIPLEEGGICYVLASVVMVLYFSLWYFFLEMAMILLSHRSLCIFLQTYFFLNSRRK